MHLEPLDVLRLGTGVAVLAFASYTDWRWRRAPDLLWWVAGAVGAAALALQAATQPWVLEQWPVLLVSAIFAGMILVLYWTGLLAGGADAKALMVLALLAPVPVHLGAFPLRASVLPPAFGILGNALLAFLLVPLGLLLGNLARRHLRFPHALLGVRMPVAEARRRHMWPMEHVKDGEVRNIWMPSRFHWEDEDWDALVAAGRSEVWVTPKVPFMLPLLAGFASAMFVGDVLTGWLLGLG